MTHDPVDSNHASGEIPELFDRLEGRVTSPDPQAIRAEATRRGTARKHMVGAAGAVVLLAAIAGAALALTRDSASTTDTAASFDTAGGAESDGTSSEISDVQVADDEVLVRPTVPIDQRGEILREDTLPTSTYITTPDYTGLLADIASRDSREIGFMVFLDFQVVDDPALVNRVIEQEPPAGTTVLSELVSTAPLHLVVGVDSSEFHPETAALEEAFDEGRTNALWTLAETRLPQSSSHIVHRVEFENDVGVLALDTQNFGNNIMGEAWTDDGVTPGFMAKPIADDQLIWRAHPATAWTGEELLVVGGSNGPGIERHAVAYSPSADSWRDLSPPPGVTNFDQLTGSNGYWINNRLILPQASLAYDVSTDEWSEIAEWPFSDRRGGLLEQTNDGLIAWGGCSGDNCDEQNTGLFDDGMRYVARTDTWTPIADGPLPAAVHVVGEWTGTELVVIVTSSNETQPAAAIYAPSTDTWSEIGAPPLSERQAADLVMSEDRLVLFGGHSELTYNRRTDGAIFTLFEQEWTLLPDAPLAAAGHTMVDFGSLLYVGGGRDFSPQVLHLPNGRSDQYADCVLAAGFDSRGAQVLFENGRPWWVKTGVEVPAEFHEPCLTAIGGVGVSGSSWG